MMVKCLGYPREQHNDNIYRMAQHSFPRLVTLEYPWLEILPFMPDAFHKDI